VEPGSREENAFKQKSRALIRFHRIGKGLSYDFLRRWGEKGPLGEGGSPLVSGEGRIEKPQTG
jgi:hypothetical protein